MIVHVLLYAHSSHADFLLSFSLEQQYGVDQTRFFLMAEVSFGSDGDFSDLSMIYKVNANLANELGNACQRTLSQVFKNCDQAVPEPGAFTDEDEKLLASAKGLRERAGQAISEQALQKYVEVMVGMIWETNKYIDEMSPWALKKTDTERMATVLYVIMEVLRYSAILYQPLIPDSANKLLDQLTVPADERTFAHLDDSYRIKSGTPISKPVGVFPRIEVPAEFLVES
jgi:methionyl-tRNA synthetase